jgi:uncharacterized protein (TIGR00288 family)
MRPTAEGLEEEKREQPKQEPPKREPHTSPARAAEPEASETEASFAPPPPPAPEPAAELPPIWRSELLVAREPEAAETLAATPSFFLPPQPRIEEEVDDEDDDDEDDDEDELVAESGVGEPGEAGESGEAGGRAETAEAREGRRRRSRGRRGGRKRSGRTGAQAGTAEPAYEEDDDLELPALPAESYEPEELPARRPIHAPAVHLPAAPVRHARPGESFTVPASDLDRFTREIVISVPERQRSPSDERKIALFCDLENVALGVRDSEVSKFDINLVLERLLEKGKIIVKKAYADWERYSDYKRPFHEAAIELIDIPQKYYSGKNSADIKMVVDAMDLSYAKEHLDTFVLLSGDSDFSPLVSKLKENNKYVIGIGVKNSSSALLIDNCDEFIFYEDVWRDTQKGPKLEGLGKKASEAFSLMIESIQALARENKDVLWGSMVKQTMQRKRPSFNEGYYGYSTFSELLEDAEKKNVIRLKKDQRSGSYIITGFAKSGEAPAGKR